MLQLSMANLLAWAAQVAAIVAAGLLLPALLRVGAPGARLVFFRALLITCLALPLLQPWALLPSKAPDAVNVEPSAIATSAIEAGTALSFASSVSRPPASRTPSQPLPWQTITVAVLAAGIAGRIGWLGLGLLSLMRLRRRSTALDPQPASVEDAALVVGCRASFRVSPRVRRPVTFGLRQPVVLVPEGFLGFAPAEQSAIACHELLHVRRRDWLRTLIEEVVCAVLWFHPAIWWLVDHIRLSAEQVIDRDVVCLLGDRRSYLQALLRLAASGREPRLQPAALFLKHSHLRQRVAMLIKETPMSRIRLAASFAVVLTVLVCGGWLVVQAFPLSAVADGPAVAVSADSMALTPGVTALSLSTAPAPVSQQGRPMVDPKGQAPRPGMTTAPAIDAWPEVSRLGTVVYPPDALQPGWVVNFVVVVGIDVAGNVTTAEVRGYEVRGSKIVFDSKAGAAASFTQMVAPLRESALDAVRQTKFKPLARAFAGFTIKCEFDADRGTAKLIPAPPPTAGGSTLVATQTGWTTNPPSAVRVGGNIVPPTKLKDIKPVYPDAARTAGVEGTVIVEAVIGEDGKVSEVRVLKSIALLDQAAIDAVRQWEFTPTLLNGQAIPVIMTMTVNFTVGSGGTGIGVGVDGGSGVGSGVGGGVIGGVAGGIEGGVVGGIASPLPPGTIRVGGNIRPPTKVVDVKPVYPAEAKDAGLQGIIIIDATIGTDGKVTNARVLKSIPMLDQAAIDAVTQWQFTSTTVDGVPVAVIMTVTVRFTLQ